MKVKIKVGNKQLTYSDTTTPKTIDAMIKLIAGAVQEIKKL